MHSAPVAAADESLYAAGFKRVLSAALALDERTKDLTVIFKSNSQCGLELLITGSDLLITDSYLDFDASHQKTSCFLWEYDIAPPKFPCHHIVIGLYESILHDLKKDSKVLQREVLQTQSSLRQKLDISLRQMPRMVGLIPGKSIGELEVSWTDLESDIVYKLYGLDLMCKVVLHRESTCSDRKTDLLYQSGESSL